MGIDGGRTGASPRGGNHLNQEASSPDEVVPAARVVPAVPTFAVDNGFWYSIPPSQQPLVQIGSVVRVPLGGRRVRGFVVEVGTKAAARLRPLASVSMESPIFDLPLARALSWAAHRYVAPVSVMLDRAAPPNLARKTASPPARVRLTVWGDHPLRSRSQAAAADKRQPPVAYVSRWWDMDWLPVIAQPVLEAGKSVMIVAGTADEVAALSQATRVWGGDSIVSVGPDLSDAETTTAWTIAQTGGRVVIGSPRIASWRVEKLAVIAVLEEGRRALKDRQTPTVAVRDLMRTRSAVSGQLLVFVGPTPSLETLAGGAEVVSSGRRAWGAVEVVDRGSEPPLAGVVGQTAIAAIRAVAARGGRVFVFAHRRGYAPAVRCERCRTLRRCPQCGSRPEASPNCPRCGAGLGPCESCGHDRFVPLGAAVGRVTEELGRLLGNVVASAPAETLVQVGSEADMAALLPLDLAVAVDPDGLILGTHFRASEEALRVLARLAGKVQGRGARCLLQTSLPEHPIMTTLRKGDPIPFLNAELDTRRQFGFPPAGELLIVEARGEVPEDADVALKDAASGATVLGPAKRSNGAVRWLLQGSDLSKARSGLRPMVQRWRDAGVTVRIDADPIEL
ncbi:MAG: hypothetical protein ACRDWH_03205 [Acidimicrobiia bacterium]